MIENIIEEIRYVWETGPTTLIAIPMLVGTLAATGWIAYSLHKNPSEAKLGYKSFNELKASGVLKQDDNRFYIKKKDLKPSDLKGFVEE